jgi:hypothetical protein
VVGVTLVLLLTVLADDEDFDDFDTAVFFPAFAGSPDDEAGKPNRKIPARQTATTVLSL